MGWQLVLIIAASVVTAVLGIVVGIKCWRDLKRQRNDRYIPPQRQDWK